jgi:hypothetical protein
MEGIIHMAQQLYEDVKQTCNKMPHAYVTLVKDDAHLVLLHQGTYHSTHIGSVPKPWNNQVQMFTDDVVGLQVHQAVMMPPLLLALVPRSFQVKNLAQQLLRFHGNDSLSLLPPVADDIPEDLCDTIKTRHTMDVPPELVSLFF